MNILKTHEDIFDEIRKKALAENKIFQAELDVTSACNAHCFFCYQGTVHNKDRNELSYREIQDVLKQLKNEGCYYISIAGGEPFLRKDILDILSYSKQLGFVVSIVSNLQTLDNDKINQLVKIGIDRISVSFHSINQELYSKIFGVSIDNYTKALENIQYLIYKNANIGILVTVSNENFDDIQNIYNFFTKLGIKDHNINFNMLVQGKSNIQGKRSAEDSKNYLSHINIPIKSILEINKNFTCTAGKISCSIDSQGNVYPCTFFNCPAGNIRNQSLKEIWSNSHMMLLLRNITENYFQKCLCCTNQRYCHVCMVNNLNENRNAFQPNDDYCNFRKMITNCIFKNNKL